MTISVLLSVYRGEKPAFLEQAISSIWEAQTLKPGQIVLVQDGPLTQELNDVIHRWELYLGDLFTSVLLPHNVGLGTALNEGLKYCRYELVARMDTDDIAIPDRFHKQIRFMNDNTEIIAVSGCIEEWDNDMTYRIGQRRLPLLPSELILFAKHRSPLNHPAVIFRKSAIFAVGGYPELRKSQDYALWSLLLVNGKKLANLPDVLLKMRAGENLHMRRGKEYLKNEIRLLQFQYQIGFLSIHELIFNLVGRSLLRLLPTWLKAFLYRIAR